VSREPAVPAGDGLPHGRRLLVLAPFTPRLDGKHGGSRALAQLLMEQCLRHAVALIYLRGREEPSIEDALRDRCALVREVPHLHPAGIGRLARRVRVACSPLLGVPVWAAWWSVPEFAKRAADVAAAWRPDLVHLEYSIMGQYAGALLHCPAPRVLVEYDAEAGSAGSNGRPAGGIHRLLRAVDRRAWSRYRAGVLRQVAAAVVFTERDRAALRPLAGGTPVVTIPLGAALPPRALSPVGGREPSLLFVGSFNHAPNAAAAARLRDGILPLVRASVPGARLVLVGTNPPPALRRPIGPHVELAEAVPDVGPYLDDASLVVVPLREGGGMRIKVLEALAAGKAVVASRLAIEGLDLRDGVECCLAESDEEFASQVVGLLRNEEQRRRLGTQARAWALEHLGWSRAAAAYERLYDQILVSGARAGQGPLAFGCPYSPPGSSS